MDPFKTEAEAFSVILEMLTPTPSFIFVKWELKSTSDVIPLDPFRNKDSWRQSGRAGDTVQLLAGDFPGTKHCRTGFRGKLGVAGWDGMFLLQLGRSNQCTIIGIS